MQSIPKLDLSHFTEGSAEQKSQFVAELGNAYEQIGFVAIRNHSIPSDIIKLLYQEVANFFDLPETIKLKYDDTEGGGQRGYTGFGKEHAKNRNTGDLKEFWHFGQYETLEDHSYPANKQVAELSNFNRAGEDVFRALENTGVQMLRAIALHLKLDEFYFDDRVTKGNSILRAIHYPPITEDPKDAIRAGEHEDINLITLLVGASADGLEVLNFSNSIYTTIYQISYSNSYTLTIPVLITICHLHTDEHRNCHNATIYKEPNLTSNFLSFFLWLSFNYLDTKSFYIYYSNCNEICNSNK